MKNGLLLFVLLSAFTFPLNAATRNLVPNSPGDGGLGTASKAWREVNAATGAFSAKLTLGGSPVATTNQAGAIAAEVASSQAALSFAASSNYTKGATQALHARIDGLPAGGSSVDTNAPLALNASFFVKGNAVFGGAIRADSVETDEFSPTNIVDADGLSGSDGQFLGKSGGKVKWGTPAGVADTNLTVPLTLLVLGDSMSAAVQPDPSITAWPHLLTNAVKRFTNLINLAVGGIGITDEMANYAISGHPVRPLAPTAGIAALWICNNDINTAWPVLCSAVSNAIVTLHADGWEVALFSLGPRGDIASGHPAEFNRVMFNAWAETQARAEYFVPVHRIFAATNSFYFWDHIHLNTNGQYRVMLAFAESVAKGPRQVIPVEPVSTVIPANRWQVNYTEAGVPALYIRGSDGYVGIGTTTPNNMLSVQGPIGTYGDQSIFNAVGPNASYVLYNSGFYDTATRISMSGSYDMLFDTFRIADGDWKERMRLKSDTGLFGIGTNAPAAALHVTANNSQALVAQFGTTNRPSLLTLDTNGVLSGNGSGLISLNTNWTGLAVSGPLTLAGSINATLTVTNNRVGIGTTTPGNTLSVIGPIGTYGDQSIFNAVGPNASYVLYNSGFYDTATRISMSGSYDMLFDTFRIADGDWKERMRLKSDTGLFGIGTNAPAAALHVTANNSQALVAQFGTTNRPSLLTLDTNGVLSGNGSGLISLNTNWTGLAVSGPLTLAGSINATLTVTNNRVGIGTTTPGNTLSVIGPIGTYGDQSIVNMVGPNSSLAMYASEAYLKGASWSMSGSEDQYWRSFDSGAGWLERMRIQNATGNVGIGTNAPAARLTVHGTVAINAAGSGAPANGSTVTAWLPISVNGTNFFLPLYQ